MFKPSLTHPRTRRAPISAIAAAGFTVAALAIATVVACSDSNTEPASPHLAYGPAQALGQGTARAYVTLDDAGKPTSLGVALSENLMNGLPQTPLPGGGMSAADLILTLPAEGNVTGFNHVMLDWNPMGHEPAGVYTIPHFDFHFYTIATADQMAIVPTDPQFNTKMESMPAETYRPVGMIKRPGGVPMMGAHWADPTSPELLPPPQSQPFTRTFLYGSYDGHFIFYEPMITKAHIESLKSVAGNTIKSSIKLPSSYEHPGYYPTTYTMTWNATAKEYRIALDNLVQKN
ncbi:MAG: DUF5602 domain-containing protein [bacterium]